MARERSELILADIVAVRAERNPDLKSSALMALARPLATLSARLESHVGGNALRQCLKRGLVTYRYRVFEARGPAGFIAG